MFVAGIIQCLDGGRNLVFHDWRLFCPSRGSVRSRPGWVFEGKLRRLAAW